MDWSQLGKKVADFAPLLGSALGPAGSAVGALIASEFGSDNTPESIDAAIKGNPDARVKLQQLQFEHNVDLKKISLEHAKLAVQDRANARHNHKNSRMPAILSVGLTFMIAAIVVLLFWVEVPPGSREVLFMLLGVAVKEWGSAMQYWFGTTRSSADKTMMIKGR